VVRQGRESFQRFLRTIVDILPPYIEKYPPSDQLLLNDFLSVLQHYDKADYQRNKLSNRFKKYCDSLLGTDQYIKTAFLWFSFTYFSNANILLNVSKFYADVFYGYLVKHLRGSSKVPGVFDLIRKNVPLTNFAWEQLQYESHKLLVPLTDDQLQVLKNVYSVVMEGGVDTLDSRKLKAQIVNDLSFPKKIKSNEELRRFFQLLEGQWLYHLLVPAFGLDWVIIHIQLQESTSLEEIIDFQDPRNAIISVSYVYLNRNLPNTYIGILRVPSQDFGRLKSYLQKCERQGRLILKSLDKVTTWRFSGSLTYYRAKTGWIEPSPIRMRRLTRLLLAQNPREPTGELLFLYTSHQSNFDWHYKDHPLTVEIVKLRCKISHHTYSYQNLPLSKQELSHLTHTDIGLLRQLHYNRVLQIRFVPMRLVNEFSLDMYCVILPKISDYQFRYFLNLIPSSDILLTEELIYLWVQLPPKLVQWIENELHWTVIPLIQQFGISNFEFSFYDPLKLQWRTPHFLQG
jgi:hypothetical protein